MSWGFVLLQPGKAPRRVTNVRDDKILTSRFWKPSFEARRCLEPASSYCEPDSGKPPNGIGLLSISTTTGGCSRSLASGSAGGAKKNGPNVELDVYSFMTTAPNALTDSINHERMPVLLSEQSEFETWLSSSVSEAFKLARSFNPLAMRIVQTGFEKKDLLAA